MKNDLLTPSHYRSTKISIVVDGDGKITNFVPMNGVKVLEIVPNQVYWATDENGKQPLARGEILMRDLEKEKQYRNAGGSNPSFMFMNVWKDGALSAKRAAYRMVKKANRDVGIARRTYRMIGDYLGKLATLTHEDVEELEKYALDMKKLAEDMESKHPGLKSGIFMLLLSGSEVKDIFERPNKERLPLILAAAQRRIMLLLKNLRSWEVDADKRAVALAELCDMAVAEAEVNRAVAMQAIHSSRLLTENVPEVSRQITILFWRECAKRMSAWDLRPWNGWMMAAASRFNLAANAYEKDDMSGLRTAETELQVAECFLRMPRLLELLDTALSPVAETRALGGELSRNVRSGLRDELKSVVADLDKIHRVIEFLHQESAWNTTGDMSDAQNDIMGVVKIIDPEGKDYLSTEDYEKMYTGLVKAGRLLALLT